jgi:IS5 family transposase
VKQTTFASLAWSNKGKVTRRERFLAEMDAVMPWTRLLALIEPHYPSDGLGRPRDPEMGSTKKGAAWHFGMKVHIGTDKRGLTHTITATSASVNDFTQLPQLLHGHERELYGDRSYWSEEHRWLCREADMRYRVNRRGTRARDLSATQRRINRSRSRIRARVEHPFNVVKRLWQFTKVRYRGVAKNLAKAYTMFALANLYLVRRRLMPRGAPCTL